MSRTRHYRDLIAWQKAMELARFIYARTEEFPKSETFGLKMQLRQSAVGVASHIAGAHGRLNDSEMRKGLGAARAAINELQTQIELAASLGYFESSFSEELLDIGSRVAKLINGLLGVLETDAEETGAREPANSPRA
ncbi:four helix bundle protein [Terracidiphilus gabretensis]|jgi:four helix bundle protein|uniref:four helix bundle protein n=1 Tax=Terracidiphilus gabretensis TaxID=1577687 RepID=UPI00071B3259|nr:four helix bundle protein [Terracidiphilus gabretensis]